MTRISPKGINRISKRLSDGSLREYHYAGRGKGAVKFWDSGSGIAIGSTDYIAAFAAAAPKGAAAQAGSGR